MKNYYSLPAVVAMLLCISTTRLSAQLSGLYTIDSNSPTAGTNYQTFAAFATDLNNQGVSGGVTVNVVPNSGPYNEQVNFTQPNLSAQNNVVINGNGNTLSFNSSNSAQPWTMSLGGADYMTVNDLTITALGSTYAFALRLWNNSSYNSFNNCEMNVPQNSTGTVMIPVTLGGNGTSYSSTGATAQNNYNTWTGCRMYNGYTSFWVYGYTGAPYTIGNKVIDCLLSDFYVYGIYTYYAYASTFEGNTIERPTRTTLTNYYGVMLNGTTVPANGTIIIDGNRFRHPNGGNIIYTGTMYGIYPQISGSLNNEIHIRNNVFENLNCNCQTLPIYNTGYQYVNIYHNTISMDDVNSTYTGASYGIYNYGNSTLVKNNLITISRGGTGSKYGLYYASTMGTGTLTSNGNNVYIKPGTPGTNYFGYHYSWGNLSAFSNWTTSTQMDYQGNNIDPIYINPNNGNFMPSSIALNDKGQPVNVVTDVLKGNRSAVTPDIGAYEFLNVPCQGPPLNSSVVTPTLVYCPGTGTANLSLSSTYTNNGMTFTWQSTTVSPVGPFNPVPNGTTQVLSVTNLTQSTWYQAVITCTNGPTTILAASGQILIAETTTNTVPYNEGFEKINGTNWLPNCSWSASNLSLTCQTYTAASANYRVPRTGNNFASFYASPTGTNYFYSNGIKLEAGVTYSASVWYLTEMLYGYNNWTDFSILLNTTKSAVNSTLIASSGNAAIAMQYKPLSNTFTVGSTGLYHVIIRGACNGTSALYLTWDDLQIIVPCTPSVNAVPLAVNASTVSVCSGMPVNLIATGADTYTWSTGSTFPVITVSPTTSGVVSTQTYYVYGQSNVSGCTSTVAQVVTVKPTPQINIAVNPPVTCAGKPVYMSASGANTYTWSNGLFGALVTVAPQTSTSYTVIGSNTPHNCTSKQSHYITVHPNPVITALANPPFMCAGETATLQGFGNASNFVWTSNSNYSQSQSTIVKPLFTTVYTLKGTDDKGCSGEMLLTLTVDECVGISSNSSGSTIRAYPNPVSGKLYLETGTAGTTSVDLYNAEGKLIAVYSFENENSLIDFSDLAAGLYHLKVKSQDVDKTIRIVKE